MTIVSKGYEGTVNYADWAVLANHLGAQYSVFGAEEFKASVGPGDRVIRLQPGGAAGPGIFDVSDAVESVIGSPVSSGSRWDLVALRRDWAAGTTTPVIITGGSTRALPAIGSTSTTRRGVPGVLDDQPIALVRFAAGQTAAQDIVDLRCWHGDGGVYASDRLVLEYLNRIGTLVRIRGEEWQRNLNGLNTPVWEQIGTAVSYQQLGVTVAGVTLPGASVSGVAILKTGQVSSTTSSNFGNEYLNDVVFDVPFPTALLSVQLTQLHQDGFTAAPPIAIDVADRTHFRALYPYRTAAGTRRSFMWLAVGY